MKQFKNVDRLIKTLLYYKNKNINIIAMVQYQHLKTYMKIIYQLVDGMEMKNHEIKLHYYSINIMKINVKKIIYHL